MTMEGAQQLGYNDRKKRCYGKRVDDYKSSVSYVAAIVHTAEFGEPTGCPFDVQTCPNILGRNELRP